MTKTTLKEAVVRHGGAAAPSIQKHLDATGLRVWADLSKMNLNALRDEMLSTVCASTAKTYCAILKAIINRYFEEVKGVSPEYAKILNVAGEKPMKVCLTPAELQALEGVATYTPVEEYVKTCFLISAKTGMRISDTLAVKPENIRGDYLTYVSKKTSVRATVPCGAKVQGWIADVCKNPVSVTEMGYNKALRRLCQRAGMDTVVRVFHAGKSLSRPKYECITSHTARATFCTCLAQAGVPLLDISRMAGHKSPNQTLSSYICDYEIQLNEKAMGYLE